MDDYIKSFCTLIRILNHFEIPIHWTTHKSIAIASVMPDGIWLNKDLWQEGEVNKTNVTMAAHALCHEFGHIIYMLWGSNDFSQPCKIDEEIWCDRFAAVFCKRLGIYGASQFEGYCK